MKRVVVAGAGPAGSAAAMGLRKHSGVECLVLDRKTFPRQKACGSGLSPWTLELLDDMEVGQLVRRHAYRIDGARIAGSRGEGIELRGHHETAVLLREELDELLAREAAHRGAELWDGVRVTRIVPNGKGIAGVETSDGFVECDGVIDATGARGKLVPSERPGKTLHTFMGWYEGVEDTSDIVELYFDEVLKPHYGWIFPETSERVNIGLVFEPTEGGPNARERFERVVGERLDERLRHATRIGKFVGHPVHVSSVPNDLSRAGVLVAGEAGRLVDAATAEGIYHGLVSGLVAGGLIGDVLSRGETPTAERLQPFTNMMRRELGARMLGGRLLVGALRTPVLDAALRCGGFGPTRSVLRNAFTGLYHG